MKSKEPEGTAEKDAQHWKGGKDMPRPRGAASEERDDPVGGKKENQRRGRIERREGRGGLHSPPGNSKPGERDQQEYRDGRGDEKSIGMIPPGAALEPVTADELCAIRHPDGGADDIGVTIK